MLTYCVARSSKDISIFKGNESSMCSIMSNTSAWFYYWDWLYFDSPNGEIEERVNIKIRDIHKGL